MNLLKNNFVVGVTAALAATVIAPVLIPAIKRGSRPLAKSLIRGGILLYEKGREAVANAGEAMEDVVAEVRAETQAPNAAPTTEAAGGFQPQEVYRPAMHGGNGSGNGASSVSMERGGAT
jgi:hypothetical protein